MTCVANPRCLPSALLPGQPSIEDLRADVVEWLRRLQANEAEELYAATGNERQLLNSLVYLCNAQRERFSAAPLPVRRRLTKPIDAVEVEVILQRHHIEDADLEDEALTGSASFPRRTLQLCVRRRQAVRPDTLANLCAAINAVLRVRGVDTVVPQADLLPVPINLDRLRQLMAHANCSDAATLVHAVNERIPAQLDVVGRRGTLAVRRPGLTADLLAGNGMRA